VGDLRLTPLEVQHGKRMTGYLLENGGRRVGYVPDCHAMPAETVERLRGVDVMILDALRYRPHPTHICVQESWTFWRGSVPTVRISSICATTWTTPGSNPSSRRGCRSVMTVCAYV
jgi:hypothetical protein